MVPHGGRDTRVWREVVDLGAALKFLEPVRGSRVESRAAIVFDYEAWWASEIDSKPSIDVRYLDLLRAFHRSLYLRGVAVDMVHPSAPLEDYDLVLVCTLYSVTDETAANIAAAAESGATVLVSYFSGIVDEKDHVRLGGYPGAFRELLGVRVEEFHPLLEGSRLKLSDGSVSSVWSEHVHAVDAETVQTFTEYPLEGVPSLTRRAVGRGAAWYLATFPDPDGIEAVVDRLLADSGVAPAAVADPGVEVVRRRAAGGGSFLFAINHTRSGASVQASGRDLLTGDAFSGIVPAGGAAVIAEEA
jgi:beta-galactosidase